MHCWNGETATKPFEADVADLQPGFTLSDSKGEKRIRMLEDSRRNLQAIIAEKQECLKLIEHEITVLTGGVQVKKPAFVVREFDPCSGCEFLDPSEQLRILACNNPGVRCPHGFPHGRR